jgi:hypothetical protein
MFGTRPYLSEKIGKGEPSSPVWMRQCGDNRTIGRALQTEALLQQQEFPDLAGSPAFFLARRRPRSMPSAHAATSLSGEATVGRYPNQSNDRLRAIFFKSAEKIGTGLHPYG